MSELPRLVMCFSSLWLASLSALMPLLLAVGMTGAPGHRLGLCTPCAALAQPAVAVIAKTGPFSKPG